MKERMKEDDDDDDDDDDAAAPEKRDNAEIDVMMNDIPLPSVPRATPAIFRPTQQQNPPLRFEGVSPNLSYSEELLASRHFPFSTAVEAEWVL